MLKEILVIATLIASVPSGYIIAYLCRDELIQGRKWFKILMITSMLVAIWSIFSIYFEVLYTMIFVFVVSLISLIKSRDKKWTRKRI